MDVDDKIIAMLALKDSTRIDPAAVVVRLKEMFPWLAKKVGNPLRQGDDPLSGFVIPLQDDTVVAVIPVHLPIPKEALERAVGMNWLWPEAADEFKQSRAHLVVSALNANNDPRLMRANAVKVTAVTAALTDLLPTVGIYWATADNVLAPAHFIDAAKEAGEDGTPYDLWVATHIYPGPSYPENDDVIVRSTGLEVFFGREIECGPSAKEAGEVAQIVRAVGTYVLDRRVQFNGGETIGEDDNPIGRIQIGRTALELDSKAVFRIVLLGGGQNG